MNMFEIREKLAAVHSDLREKDTGEINYWTGKSLSDLLNDIDAELRDDELKKRVPSSLKKRVAAIKKMIARTTRESFKRVMVYDEMPGVVQFLCDGFVIVRFTEKGNVPVEGLQLSDALQPDMFNLWRTMPTAGACVIDTDIAWKTECKLNPARPVKGTAGDMAGHFNPHLIANAVDVLGGDCVQELVPHENGKHIYFRLSNENGTAYILPVKV